MKKITFILLLIIHCNVVTANDRDPKNAQAQAKLIIRYSNHHLPYTHTDSVCVIVDKYDRTGAAIVWKVFYPGQECEIRLPELQPGKYVVYIRFLGFHRERFKKTIIIKKHRTKKLSIALTNWAEYHRGQVNIPATTFKSDKLIITAMK